MTMKSRVFTDRERKRLRRWLDSEVEDDTTDRSIDRGDEAKRSEADGGSGAVLPGEKETPESGAVEGEAERETKIRVFITARRVRIDPEEKRTQYIARLERLIADLDRIIANPKTSAKNRLRAMDILIRAVTSCYGIVRDAEVEQLERETEEVKTESEGKEKDLGYDIEPEKGPPR